MTTTIRKPEVAKHKPRLTAEPFDPSKVSTTLNVVVARTVLADKARTARILDAHNWSEVRLSDCEFGCKVYRHAVTGVERVEHHNVYGCPL